MTKVEVFSRDLTTVGLTDLEETVKEFIKNKKVINTEILQLGNEVFFWIFYE